MTTCIVVAAVLLAAGFVAGRWTADVDPELDAVDQWRARLRETAEPKPAWWHHHVHPSLGQTLVMSIESPAPDPYEALSQIDPIPDYVEPIPIGIRHEGRHREGVALGTVAQRDPVCVRQNQSVITCWLETTPPLRAPWEIETDALDLELIGLLNYTRSEAT